MATSTITFHLDAPPECVFDYIADIRNDGTSVTMLVDMKLRGAFKALAPMLKVGMPREMEKRPKQFAAALSGR